jgi:hypothetical protein
LGGPSVPIARAGGGRQNQLRVKPQPPVLGCGDKQGTERWYRQAKATKCGETGGRESERPIVSPKRGNRPSWTPWREGDAASWDRCRDTY